MSKFWMMGVAAITVTVAVVALDSRPVRSSEDLLGNDLLGKAQSEFAIKARDALVQRRMVQASTAPELASAPPSIPQTPYRVASLEPVAPPTIAAPQAIVVPVAPVSPAATVDSPEAPVASRPVAKKTEEKIEEKTEVKEPTAEPQVTSLPGSPATENAVTPKPAATVAVTPELTKVAAKGVTPTGGGQRERAKNIRQVQHASNAPRTAPRAKTIVRRSETYASRNSMPYGMEALRARAPEIAAAIARYM
jgi:hypothetical protein